MEDNVLFMYMDPSIEGQTWREYWMGDIRFCMSLVLSTYRWGHTRCGGWTHHHDTILVMIVGHWPIWYCMTIRAIVMVCSTEWWVSRSRNTRHAARSQRCLPYDQNAASRLQHHHLPHIPRLVSCVTVIPPAGIMRWNVIELSPQLRTPQLCWLVIWVLFILFI